MTQPNWHSLAANIAVPANPPGLWTKVIDFIADPQIQPFALAGSEGSFVAATEMFQRQVHVGSRRIGAFLAIP